MKTPLPLDDRAAQLREVFDRSFQAAPAEPSQQTEDFLLIRVANLPYALRIAEVSGVEARRRVVPVPSKRTDLLGLAGIRGSLVCVYDLAALLAHASDSAPTWLVLCGSPDPIGLAFQEMEVFVRASRTEVHEEATTAKRLVRGVVRTGPATRPIVDLNAIVEVIKSRGSAAPGQPRSPT